MSLEQKVLVRVHGQEPYAVATFASGPTLSKHLVTGSTSARRPLVHVTVVFPHHAAERIPD